MRFEMATISALAKCLRILIVIGPIGYVFCNVFLDPGVIIAIADDMLVVVSLPSEFWNSFVGVRHSLVGAQYSLVGAQHIEPPDRSPMMS